MKLVVLHTGTENKSDWVGILSPAIGKESLGLMDVLAQKISLVCNQAALSKKKRFTHSLWYFSILHVLWLLSKKHLLSVFCSQVTTAEAPQEPSYPINGHNEGPQQHDCLRMEGRAMALYPGFINKLPDVLKNKMVFDWIVGGVRFLHILWLLYFSSSLWF